MGRSLIKVKKAMRICFTLYSFKAKALLRCLLVFTSSERL